MPFIPETKIDPYTGDPLGFDATNKYGVENGAPEVVNGVGSGVADTGGSYDYSGYLTDIPDISTLIGGEAFSGMGDLFGTGDAFQAALQKQFPSLDPDALAEFMPGFQRGRYESIIDMLKKEQERKFGLIGQEYDIGVGDIESRRGIAGKGYETAIGDIKSRFGFAQRGFKTGLEEIGTQRGFAQERFGEAGLERRALESRRERELETTSRRFTEGRAGLRGTVLGQAAGLRQRTGGFAGTGETGAGLAQLSRKAAEKLESLTGGYRETVRGIEEATGTGMERIGLAGREAESRFGTAEERLRTGAERDISGLKTEISGVKLRRAGTEAALTTEAERLGLSTTERAGSLQEAIESGVIKTEGMLYDYISGLYGGARGLAQLGALKGQQEGITDQFGNWVQTDQGTWVNVVSGETYTGEGIPGKTQDEG